MSVTPTSSSSTPQHRSTPQPQASPAPSSSTSMSSKSSAGQAGNNEKKNSKGRNNAPNVFTNDGSFLERFQRNKKEDEDKKKAEADIMRKRTFDERFKNRGKRPVPHEEPPSTPVEDPPLKRLRGDKEVPLTAQYEKEVKSYAGRSLKDDGIGVRPLVK